MPQGRIARCVVRVRQIDELIYHYLGHGYELLHIGTETRHDGKANLMHSTVAVLGKP